ncbi:MAG: hypothetical protein U5K27_06955 [Desulfotignum sp.]|nr:hypothetical protein [Desulfotignum sp.]
MATDFTSITGIVIPASWDAGGTILGTAIVTFDEDHITVADTGPGSALIPYLRKTVTVTGQLQIQGNSKTIHVREFNVLVPGEAAGQTVIDRSGSGC